MSEEKKNTKAQDMSKTKLGNSWTLFENYQSQTQKTFHNYSDTHNKLYELSTLGQFALLYNDTPYLTPSELFYDDINNNIRKFKLKDADSEEKVIDGIQWFKKGILPMWEDPANQNGCSFVCTFKGINPSEIDNLWRDVITDLVCEKFPFMDYITGVTITDRLKKHSSVKIEIWISVSQATAKLDSDEPVKYEFIIQKITGHFIKLLNKTTPVSEFDVTKNEHKIRLKVN